MIKSLAFISLLSVSFFSGPLVAQVYRWINDQGHVVFSQSPPGDGRDTTTLDLPPDPPAEAAEEDREKLDGQIKKLDQAEQERNLRKQAAAEKRAVAKYDKQQCTTARTNLDAIVNRPPQTLFQRADGSYMRLTAEEREEQIRMATLVIEKHCR